MRILIDTNIIISVVVFPNSITAGVWNYIIAHRHHVIISTHIITELKAVFQRKFPAKTNDLQRFFENFPFEIIYSAAKQPHINIPFIRDETDIPILTDAIAANADILLTGDKDFFDIPLDKPLVMSPGTFMELYMSVR